MPTWISERRFFTHVNINVYQRGDKIKTVYGSLLDKFTSELGPACSTELFSASVMITPASMLPGHYSSSACGRFTEDLLGTKGYPRLTTLYRFFFYGQPYGFFLSRLCPNQYNQFILPLIGLVLTAW